MQQAVSEGKNVVLDMDLVRALVLAIELDPELDGTCEINDYGPERFGLENYSATEGCISPRFADLRWED
jgi:hypothetical protein